MPFPSVPPTGYAPSTVTTPIGVSSGVITPEVAQRLQTLWEQHAMMGQDPGWEPPQAGQDATEFLTNLYFSGQAQFATELAEQTGIDRNAFLANVAQVNEESQARRRAGYNPLQRFMNVTVGEHIPELTRAALIAGTAIAGGAAAAGLGGSGAGLGGTGTATVSGSNAAAGAAGATTTPYVAGGAITGSAIPGVTSATTAANAAAAGIGPAVAGGAAVGGAGAATNALGNAPAWVGNYLLPGLNAGLGIYGANQAANAMSDASAAAVAEGARQYDQSRSDLMPWLDAGRNALGRLQDPGASFEASPDYEFVRNEGLRGIENRFSARGGAASGNALRALSEFNSGLASQEFGNYWNRQAGLAGVGQTAGTTLGGLGANQAANAGNAMMGQGVARASGVLGRTNLLQNALFDSYDNYLYRRRRA